MCFYIIFFTIISFLSTKTKKTEVIRLNNLRF